MARSPLKSIDFYGEPVEVRYATRLLDTAGNEAHAATYIRERRIMLDEALKSIPAEHDRVLMHELLHFAWVRLGNARRLLWEAVLRAEWQAGTHGEAGWSAEWRKSELNDAHVAARNRPWREYCCESFCDTGSLVYTGHAGEATLLAEALTHRTRWFESNLGGAAHI